MKTLTQLEPRTPLAGGTAAITISQSGSYFLTGNLTVATGDAITINASGVTLDLRRIHHHLDGPDGNGLGDYARTSNWRHPNRQRPHSRRRHPYGRGIQRGTGLYQMESAALEEAYKKTCTCRESP